MTQLRILVVDDDPGLRSAVAEAVALAPDMTLAGEAQGLQEGLRLLSQLRPDVLLVDLGLPDGNGIRLIRRAAAVLPDCEVVVVTVFGGEQHVLASLEAGATGYLLKDASVSEIIDQLRVLRDGGSPISPVIARRLLQRFAAWGEPHLPAAGAPGPGLAPHSPVAANEPAPVDSSALLPGPDDGMSELSPREDEVLRLCAKGYSYREIAPLLGVSPHTVTGFVKRIYRKLQVHSKAEAVYEARRLGLLSD